MKYESEHIKILNRRKSIMKNLEFGFVILCPEKNTGGLKATASSIRSSCPNSPAICLVGDNCKDEEMQGLGRFAAIYKGRNSITSIINVGMEISKADWNCFVMAGVIVRPNIHKRLQRFLVDENEVIYPVLMGRDTWRFENSSLNGFFIHKAAFKKAGNFIEEDSSLENTRLLWAANAIENGIQLKGLVGLRF